MQIFSGRAQGPAPTRESMADVYNTIPYESYAVKQTHPRNLCAIASLYGLQPPDIETCKVLEIGCASGDNLIPMAFYYPKAQFVGFDLAQNQIDQGLQHIHNLQLNNITLFQQSINDFKSTEKFDYIICHGVYSWVDSYIQDQILALCQKYLSANGIAYVSYNTLPGWHFPNIVREMMLLHTQGMEDGIFKAQKARAFLEVSKAAIEHDFSDYAQLLKKEIDFVCEHSDSYLLHEHLSAQNTPCYFHEFVTRAQKHQLQYVSEAFLSTMQNVDNMTTAQISDFMHNRRFRCALLCHEALHPRASISHSEIDFFYAAQERERNHIPALPLKPQIATLALYQSKYRNVVTNIFHENIQLDDFAEIWIPYLDGTHTVEDLVKILFNFVEAGELIVLNEADLPIYELKETLQRIEYMCNRTLSRLNQKCLF